MPPHKHKIVTWPHAHIVPMTAHPNGQWCKKIKGKVYYFGTIDKPDAALREWQLRQRDIVEQAGVIPSHTRATIRAALNAYIQHIQRRMDTGDSMTPRTFSGYRDSLRAFARHIDTTRRVGSLRPADFASVRRLLIAEYNPTTTGNIIRHVKTAFRWLVDTGIIQAEPQYGVEFRQPPARVKRRIRNDRSIYTAAELRTLLAAASPRMRVWLTLGINCGFGQGDLSDLAPAMLDGRFVTFPRPKTGIDRRCYLWLRSRRLLASVASSGDYLLTTRHGNRLVRDVVHRRGGVVAKVTRVDAVNHAFAKLCKSAGIESRGFYSVRHTFRTVAGGAKDPEAAAYIMGHALPGMSSVYVHDVDDQRLRDVALHVHGWLHS